MLTVVARTYGPGPSAPRIGNPLTLQWVDGGTLGSHAHITCRAPLPGLSRESHERGRQPRLRMAVEAVVDQDHQLYVDGRCLMPDAATHSILELMGH
jgi:hypothetical protein